MYPNIEAERARSGFTLDEFVKRIGISRKTYYNWRQRGNIPLNKVEKMAELFHCSTDYLLSVEPRPSKNEEIRTSLSHS